MPKLGYYERGNWNAVCDECGRPFKFTALRQRWDKAWVCSMCYEPRQPQDFARSVKDDPSVPVARPRIVPATVLVVANTVTALSVASPVSVTPGTGTNLPYTDATHGYIFSLSDSGNTEFVLVTHKNVFLGDNNFAFQAPVSGGNGRAYRGTQSYTFGPGTIFTYLETILLTAS